MTQFIFNPNEENEAYCLEIAQVMTIFFAIPMEDAIARINKQWGSANFGNSELLYHETPHYWAQWIFFGERSWKGIDPVATTNLARIERKMNLIMDHLGLDYTSVSDHMAALLRRGEKFQALQLYHKEVGVPMGEAKRVIDQLAVSLAPPEQP